MDLNDSLKDKIAEAIRIKNVTRGELAAHLGLTNSWVTKLLKPVESGGLKSLSDAQSKLIEEYLGIQFYVQISESVRILDCARNLSARAEKVPELRVVLDSLDRLTQGGFLAMRGFREKELVLLGNEILKIVEASNGDALNVASRVLELVQITE